MAKIISQHIGWVESLNHAGDGVVKIEGKVYFIAGALPGEKINFSVTRKRRSKFSGKLEQVIIPSAQRVEPSCQYFGTCGGCVLQHLEQLSQLEAKQKILLDNLSKIGKVRPNKIIPSLRSAQTGYRRKARFGIRYVPKKGGTLIGFRERRSSYVTSLQQCLTLDSRISSLLPSLHQLIDSLSCRQHIPQIECAVGDNTVALVFRHLQPLTPKDLILMYDYAAINQVNISLQSKGPDSIISLSQEEPEKLFYRIPEYNLRFEFGATDFIQVNGKVNEAMIASAIQLLDISAGDQLLDLFCGLGNFTLPLARQSVPVHGVESNQYLVNLGRLNALNNGLHEVIFSVSDLYQSEQVSQLQSQTANKILLDPPRSGAHEVVTILVPAIKPERIVYISCNPATLARDSALLVHQHGYQLQSLGAIDMFPHTAHIEAIAVFERR